MSGFGSIPERHPKLYAVLVPGRLAVTGDTGLFSNPKRPPSCDLEPRYAALDLSGYEQKHNDCSAFAAGFLYAYSLWNLKIQAFPAR